MNNLQSKTIADAHAPAPVRWRRLRVLVACEESQRVCIAFRALGHLAFSADIQPCRGGHPEWHILGDVTPLLRGLSSFITSDGKAHHLSQFDLIIAHPPCTYLCKLGAQHLYKNADTYWCDSVTDEVLHVNGDRLHAMKCAARFFRHCLNASAKYVAVENPLPMRLAQLPSPTTYIQPFWFGEKYTKKTLLWLKNLPPLMPTIEHSHPKQFVRASRGKYRARTFPGVAAAMALQWSEYILNDIHAG